MARFRFRTAVAFLAVSLASLSASVPLRAQDPNPVHPAFGYELAGTPIDLPTNAVLGGLVYAPDGRLIVYETATAEIRFAATPAAPPLLKLDPVVFGSFLVVAPDGLHVIFAESTANQIYSVALDGSGSEVADHIPFAFDLAFDAAGRGFVSAPGLSGDNSIRLLDSDPAVESPELVVGLAGFSGPVAVDAAGHLYYGTSNGGSQTGQSILRFRKEQLDQAIGGDPLEEADGELVVGELGGLYGLKVSGEKLFYTDLGFSSGSGGLYLLDPESGLEPMLVSGFQVQDGLLSPSFLAFRPGTRDFGPGVGPQGGVMAVAYSDFAAVNGLAEIRPELHFVRGRVNGDSAIDLSDAIAILAYLFSGSGEPESIEAADVNDDSTVDLSDAVYLLEFLFRGGPTIPAPYPDAGPDA